MPLRGPEQAKAPKLHKQLQANAFIIHRLEMQLAGIDCPKLTGAKRKFALTALAVAEARRTELRKQRDTK